MCDNRICNYSDNRFSRCEYESGKCAYYCGVSKCPKYQHYYNKEYSAPLGKFYLTPFKDMNCRDNKHFVSNDVNLAKTVAYALNSRFVHRRIETFNYSQIYDYVTTLGNPDVPRINFRGKLVFIDIDKRPVNSNPDSVNSIISHFFSLLEEDDPFIVCYVSLISMVRIPGDPIRIQKR